MPSTDPATTVFSMTGFGTARGTLTLPDGRSIGWVWEMKAVNGRGFDVRFRMPPGFDALEPRLRKAAAPIGRGSVTANLQLDGMEAAKEVSLDEKALATIVKAVEKVRLQIECSPPSADGLLALKGVLSVTEDRFGEEERAALFDGLAAGFNEALNAFQASRATEGAQMATVLGDQVTEIERLTNEARAQVADAVAAHLDTLKEQIATLLGDTNLPDERLAQEATLIAVRTDIREELDRLDAHVAAARDLLTGGGIVGRKLDFLGQEFVREANTLTTKAPSMALKQVGLSLKGVVDQFKEQVQNIA